MFFGAVDEEGGLVSSREEEICVEHKGIRIGEIVIVGVASCGGKHLEIWKIANLYRGEVVGQQALQPNTS